jgi:hypothetical protein
MELVEDSVFIVEDDKYRRPLSHPNGGIKWKAKELVYRKLGIFRLKKALQGLLVSKQKEEETLKKRDNRKNQKDQIGTKDIQQKAESHWGDGIMGKNSSHEHWG